MAEKKLSEVISDLSDCVDAVMAHFDKIDRNDLKGLLTSYAHLKDNNDRLKQLAEILEKLQRELSYEVIPNVMESHGFDSVKADGRLFTISTRLNANISENQREAGHRWITDVAKVPELIIPRVNPKQLSSFVKTYFEQNAEYPPEEAITIHLQNYIQVRKV